MLSCPQCGAPASGTYCASCGQLLKPKRITTPSVLHEVFHFFTHLDKGFPYTLKQLLLQPGTMQRQYVAGQRSRHQKPFSMFFLCITAAALGLYWIDGLVLRIYGAGEAGEVAFFNKYLVLVQLLSLPLYALIVYLFFRRAGYNYAEVAVQQLYAFSFVFLLLVVIHLLKFAWPGLETRYVEVPVIGTYFVITNLRFFTSLPRWQALLFSVLAFALSFALASALQDALVKLF